jgi:phytoene synthase
MRAYLDTATRFSIPREVMAPYFRAMRQDLSVRRFPTFQHLVHYMEGSALPVGRAMTHILGVLPEYSLSDALPGADALSIAMQLSNFWRDIGEDWRRGRIYIPVEDMDTFGYGESNLATQRVEARFIALMEYQFERTEFYYEKARRSVRLLASGNWAVLSALEIYRAILPGIRANGYDVFTRRAGTSAFQKLSLAMRSMWQVRSL